jgi:hypothetical protein
MNIKNEIMEKYMFFVFNMFYILPQMTFYVFFFVLFLAVVVIASTALQMLGNCSIYELYPWPQK